MYLFASEAYLEGMKTILSDRYYVQIFVRPKPTSKEWKPEYKKHSVPFHPVSEAYLEGMKTEWYMKPYTVNAKWSEAYLEGMKTVERY